MVHVAGLDVARGKYNIREITGLVINLGLAERLVTPGASLSISWDSVRIRVQTFHCLPTDQPGKFPPGNGFPALAQLPTNKDLFPDAQVDFAVHPSLPAARFGLLAIPCPFPGGSAILVPSPNEI